MRTSEQLAMVPGGMVKILGLGIGKAQPTHTLMAQVRKICRAIVTFRTITDKNSTLLGVRAERSLSSYFSLSSIWHTS